MKTMTRFSRRSGPTNGLPIAFPAAGAGHDYLSPVDREGIDLETFPEVTIGRGLTAQLVWVTPKFADAGLKMRDDGRQRSIKERHKQAIATDVIAGRWRLNGEPIIFSSEGLLIQGQHRLEIVVETGYALLSLVIRGVRPEAYTTLDTTSKRTGADALKALDFANTTSLAGAANYVWRYERGNIYDSGTITASTVADVVARHPGLIPSTVVGQRAGKVCQSRTVPAFCHYAFASVDRDRADRFIDHLATGVELRRNDPVYQLRERLIKGRFFARETLGLMILAWESYLRSKPLRSLNWDPKNDPFPVLTCNIPRLPKAPA